MNLRVLKPPGGGSSDIFGTASCDEVNPHKRGTNQKNLQSSIILGGQSPTKTTNVTDTTATDGNSEKYDGNPITGEGYEAPKPAANPTQHVSAQSEPAPEQKKASRVPPGGYSSGLW
ncbi:microtubule-associated protein Jupiter-like isoform X5 [Sipha flava]|uniref:Microtubule-associated protein Jupiter-like isoform X5 n=1 Tax=Sipha flava TaxID=143950 RepID=A0A8B8G8S7_9HEMI|nr:microtubule-associated protein Jupiter-like isoform X5 [Sipha flava]